MTTATQTPNLREELSEIRRETRESLKLVKGPDFTVDLSEWLTIKNYAEKYGISTQVVSNWISRKTIPADCVMEFPELNNIKIVRDRSYIKS